jgi:hypothetical protein
VPLVGNLLGYGEIWYNPNGIANIMLLSRVKEHGFFVTLTSANGNEFHFYKPNGNTQVFQQSSRGVYYIVTQATGIALVNTVEDNKSIFTNHDYSRALLVCTIQKTIGRPSNCTFLKIIKNKLLPRARLCAMAPHYFRLVLGGNIMFVNKLPFFVTILRHPVRVAQESTKQDTPHSHQASQRRISPTRV